MHMTSINEKDVTVVKRIAKQADGAKYEYTLFYERSKKVASFGLSLYSVSVKMTKDGQSSERVLREIFSDLGKACVFFDTVADNLVTPIDLPYVLEDKIVI